MPLELSGGGLVAIAENVAINGVNSFIISADFENYRHIFIEVVMTPNDGTYAASQIDCKPNQASPLTEISFTQMEVINVTMTVQRLGNQPQFRVGFHTDTPDVTEGYSYLVLQMWPNNGVANKTKFSAECLTGHMAGNTSIISTWTQAIWRAATPITTLQIVSAGAPLFGPGSVYSVYGQK